MHVQVVNFRLSGLDEAGYAALCDELAPAFAGVPGLLAKVWLADETSGVHGGVYVWESAAAMQSFAASELFAAVVAHPNLVELTSQDWGVLTAPTAVTSNLVVPAA